MLVAFILGGDSPRQQSRARCRETAPTVRLKRRDGMVAVDACVKIT